jgi:phage terminase large subunit
MNIRIPEKLVPLLESKARFNVIYGGRASSKSHTIARLLIIKALKEKCLILCTRHIQKSIAASSYSLLVKIINEYELNQYFNIVDNEIRCTRTGSKFIFQGLWQNLDNIKSLEGVNYCWVEEAKAVSHDAWRVLIPTLRAEGSQFYITFNPDMIDDPVYGMFITHERPDSLVIKINYDKNPFLSETSKKEISYMQESNPDMFEWIYKGNVRATSESRILTNIKSAIFDIDKSKQPHYGLDLGYNDPNALVQSYISDNCLYICNEYYTNQLSPDELKEQLSNLEWIRGQHIIADSSQPSVIKMLNATGRFSVTGSKKSVGQTHKEGMYKRTMALYLKTFKEIVIHADRCTNAFRELSRWSWSMDKNEKILDIVLDLDDHIPDALIYSLETQARIWYANNFKR